MSAAALTAQAERLLQRAHDTPASAPRWAQNSLKEQVGAIHAQLIQQAQDPDTRPEQAKRAQALALRLNALNLDQSSPAAPRTDATQPPPAFARLLSDLGGNVSSSLDAEASSSIASSRQSGSPAPFVASSTAPAPSTSPVTSTLPTSAPLFLPRPPRVTQPVRAPAPNPSGLRRRHAPDEADDLEAEYGHSSAPEPSQIPGRPIPAKEQAEQDEKENSSQAVQDGLTGELLRMAGVLKANSVAFAQALERDRVKVEMAEGKLSSNLDFITRTRGTLGQVRAQARSMTWLTLGSLLTVVISWLVVFVVVRLT